MSTDDMDYADKELLELFSAVEDEGSSLKQQDEPNSMANEAREQQLKLEAARVGGQRYLYYAVLWDDRDLLFQVLEKTKPASMSAGLVKAIRLHNHEFVKAILAAGADPNDSYRRPLIKACAEQDPQVIALLLDAGATGECCSPFSALVGPSAVHGGQLQTWSELKQEEQRRKLDLIDILSSRISPQLDDIERACFLASAQGLEDVLSRLVEVAAEAGLTAFASGGTRPKGWRRYELYAAIESRDLDWVRLVCADWADSGELEGQTDPICVACWQGSTEVLDVLLLYAGHLSKRRLDQVFRELLGLKCSFGEVTEGQLHCVERIGGLRKQEGEVEPLVLYPCKHFGPPLEPLLRRFDIRIEEPESP